MNSISKAYRVFSSKIYRIVMNLLIGLGAVMMGLFTFAIMIDTSASVENSDALGLIDSKLAASVMIVAAMVSVFVFFGDYFVFVGISARHTGTMAAIRASFQGEKLIENGLIGDFVVNAIRTFISGPLVCIVATFIINGTSKLYTVAVALAVWGAMMITIGVVNLVSRRFTKTILGMVVFTYVGAAILGVFSVAITLMITAINSGLLSPVISIAAAVAFPVLAVVVFMIGKKDALKGYKSGFEDKVGGK